MEHSFIVVLHVLVRQLYVSPYVCLIPHPCLFNSHVKYKFFIIKISPLYYSCLHRSKYSQHVSFLRLNFMYSFPVYDPQPCKNPVMNDVPLQLCIVFIAHNVTRSAPCTRWGHIVAQLIEALRYKTESRGFNCR